jgi:cell pole-organizing protein PopZ
MSGTPQDPPKPGAGDPAMDDILASIRRILNEDEAPAASPAADAAPVTATQAEPLDLTEAMMIDPPATPAPAAPLSAEAAPVAEEASPAPAAGTLVAPAVLAATTAAVGQLLKAVAQERSTPIHRSGPSIEDVVREELRPLLKEWLDLHLPQLVERLVRAEIERVVGRALP